MSVISNLTQVGKGFSTPEFEHCQKVLMYVQQYTLAWLGGVKPMRGPFGELILPRERHLSGVLCMFSLSRTSQL